MDEALRREALQKAIRPKFRGKPQLKSKVHTHYPEGVEREYLHITDAYMQAVSKAVQKYLPEIRDAARREREGMRLDGNNDMMRAIEDAFAKMGGEIDEATSSFDLRRKINRLSLLVRSTSYKNWKKQVKATLGIDLMDDYYLGEFYRTQLEMWVNANVGKIQTLPQSTIDSLKGTMLQGFREGKGITSIVKEMQELYGMKKREARFIARDQLGTLNSQITKFQQTDAGVKRYIWSSSGDSRVRSKHREFNNERYSWDDPPMGDNGRCCHPGEDYGCRCVALPVFEADTFAAPASAPQKGGK